MIAALIAAAWLPVSLIAAGVLGRGIALAERIERPANSPRRRSSGEEGSAAGLVLR